jgi:hypothetical protein
MTGTREVREALAVADQLLARAELPAAPAAAERSREDLPMAA